MRNIYYKKAGFNRCLWYEQAKTNDLNKYVLETKPSGVFYAIEVSPQAKTSNPVINAFLLDRATITLKTNDTVDGLDNNCVVMYNNKPWIVVDAQTEIQIKATEFTTKREGYTYINLRR